MTKQQTSCRKHGFLVTASAGMAQAMLGGWLLLTPPSAVAGAMNATLHGLEFIAPAARWALRVELRQNGFDHFYDASGNRQVFGSPFDGVALDSRLFPDLAAFGAGATLGTTRFDARVDTRRVELTLGYGLTDNLTVGLIVPYGTVTTTVNFSVSGGNVGFNPAFDPGQPAGLGNPPLLPVGAGADSAVGTQGVQTILSDPAFGLGYRPLAGARWQGVGDPTIGLLWRFYRSEVDALIFGTGIRIGMAPDVDPDNLLEVPLDDGTTDYRARLEYYRNLGTGFDLKLATEYTYQFEDTVTRRVPVAGSLLAPAASKESLRRKLGNYLEYDVGIGKALGDWRLAGTWHRYVKQADRYTASSGTDTTSLQADTDLYANQWRASLSWSGIRAWRQGDLPLPLIVQLEWQETYAGKNFSDVSDVYIQITSFF